MVQVVGILIVGASSTGKTTLCRALERVLVQRGFPVFHIAEVARTVMKIHGFTRDDVGTLAMQKTIMREQILEENRRLFIIESSKTRPKHEPVLPSVLLCDRTAIDPVVYATMKLEPDSVQEMTQDPLFREALSRYRTKVDEPTERTGKKASLPQPSLRSTIILTDGVKEWIEDDGIRSLYDPFEVTGHFRQLLRGLGVEWHEIGENIKDIQKRVDWILNITGLDAYGATGSCTLGRN
jgi:GTPase SAR1 family protein